MARAIRQKTKKRMSRAVVCRWEKSEEEKSGSAARSFWNSGLQGKEKGNGYRLYVIGTLYLLISVK